MGSCLWLLKLVLDEAPASELQPLTPRQLELQVRCLWGRIGTDATLDDETRSQARRNRCVTQPCCCGHRVPIAPRHGPTQPPPSTALLSSLNTACCDIR